MISRIRIEHFKSVELAAFQACRVNVLIGEPNSGKSNILEALGLLNPNAIKSVKETFRIEQVADLFGDQDVTKPVKILAEHLATYSMQWSPEGSFKAALSPWDRNAGYGFGINFLLNPTGTTVTPDKGKSELRTKYFKYRESNQKPRVNSGVPELLVPFGENLPSLLAVHKPLRDSVASLVKSFGFRLEVRPGESRILITKEVDDVFYSFPFEAISETLRRIIFYKAVLETNDDSVLILDEPEAHTFPFYTKYLAERIALDTSNQFFLSTHNPYVLMSIIEKTPVEDLAVFVTRMRNFRTEVQPLTPEQRAEALDLGMDVFLNLDRYFPE